MLDLSYMIPDMTNTERTEERKQIQWRVCYVTTKEETLKDMTLSFWLR